MKPIKGWVVIDTDGEMILPTLNWSKRSYSTKSFIRNRDSFYSSAVTMTWEAYQNRGYRCIRVTLRADE